MARLLKTDVSHRGDWTVSRALGEAFPHAGSYNARLAVCIGDQTFLR
jgi:hypothetical protein